MPLERAETTSIVSAARSNGDAFNPVVVTHVSVLHFTADRVFKFKRPLELPFVDLRELGARRRACEAELAVNQRLSPDVYLGVADLTLEGEIVDYAVVMRRLPADRQLSALVAAGKVDAKDIERLAHVLAVFHTKADRSEAVSAAARPDAISATWLSVARAVRHYCGEVLDERLLRELNDKASRFVEGHRPLFEDRIRRGHICDGHGDLLADDVFLLDDGPRILDGLDFDPTLRHTDVAADLAFLVMDLEAKGARRLAAELVWKYEQASGQQIPVALLHYYCAQRALVRCHVACLRAVEGAKARRPSAHAYANEARHLLAEARRHLDASETVLAVMAGVPGSGKSTITRAAASALGWTIMSSDEIRRELVGPETSGPLLEAEYPGAYNARITSETYDRLFHRVETALRHGHSVFVDATFIDPHYRRVISGLARSTCSILLLFECRIPLTVAVDRVEARLAVRTSTSGADGAVVRSLYGHWEPWEEAVVLDSEQHRVGQLVDLVVDTCRSRTKRRPRRPTTTVTSDTDSREAMRVS